jgi:aminopeptidase N
MKHLYLPAIFLFCSIILFAQIPAERFARERTYDILHYKLNISVDLMEKTCVGDVSIKLVPLRPMFIEVLLDAADMSISSVRLDIQQLHYEQRGETLFVTLDKPYGLSDTLNLTVSYSVSSPRKGLYFVTPDSGYPQKQYQAWTQGEAEDNHYWFPCYDYPNDFATSEMIVTVGDRLTAISNGKLIELKKNPKNHIVTYHWLESKPHVSYLISLIVGEYVEIKDSLYTLPISYFVYKHQRDDAMRSFEKTPKMIEFFSSKTGYPYPWEKFSQTVVADFIFGGQENVSAVTLNDNTIHDARAHLDNSSDGLVAHELAHQWFGDLITCKDWSHAWLNEGFASYFENLFREYDLSKDDAAKAMLDNQNTLSNVDRDNHRRPTVCNRYINPMDVFDNRIYGKGAVVLNMLRDYLGDELFFKAINHYVDKFAYRCVETNDFKNAIEEATGYNLYWFFNQWVYKAGCPTFDVTSRWDQSSRSVQLTVKQTQNIDSLTGIFKTPVEIEVWVHGQPETHRVLISNAEETFSFPAYRQPDLIIFDKGSKILKKVNFQKSTEEWIFQLEYASDGVDRLHAIDELQWYPGNDSVVDALSRAALEDKFWAVRSDAVWALAGAKQSWIRDTLIVAYGDRDARVRTAVVGSMGKFKSEQVLGTLQHAFEKDSSYSVSSGALQSLVMLDSTNRKSYLEKALQQDSHNEILRRTALNLLSQQKDEYALQAVTSYTRYGIEQNLRIQAVNILASSWKERDDVLYYLIKSLKDPSFYFQRAVIRVLGEIGDARAEEPLQKYAASATDSRITKDARDAIDKIQEREKDNEDKDN